VQLIKVSPFSAFSSVPGPELDWLPTEEGGAKRLFSSSLPLATSPPSELLRESLRAEREEDVLLVSLRGLLELRPVWDDKKIHSGSLPEYKTNSVFE